MLACLEKKPEDRQQSVAELAPRLSAIGLEPWTDAQAEAWWKTTGLTMEQGRGEEITHLRPVASGTDETRAG